MEYRLKKKLLDLVREPSNEDTTQNVRRTGGAKSY